MHIIINNFHRLHKKIKEIYGEGYILNIVYKKREFNVYGMDEGYIIHNTKKPFEQGHSHVYRLTSCKYLIDLCIHSSIPHHLNRYFLVTLKRISNDEDYIAKIDGLLESKDNKSHDRFYNKPKSFSKKNKIVNNRRR